MTTVITILPLAVTLVLKATGSAPIMTKRKWMVEPEKPVSWVISFVHNYLKLDKSEHLFLYVNQTFAPSPDQTLRNLYDCYATNGTLTLNYCNSQAWG